MASAFQRALKCLSTLESYFLKAFQFRFPSNALAPVYAGLPAVQENKLANLNELLNEAVLWAVPKRRRSIEKRRTRRFGYGQYLKMLVPKTHILTCPKCGSYYEAKMLCPTCYSKIKRITEEMQETIQANLGVSPVESEVVVLYEGQKADPDFYKGKRIIEMKKPKPQLFSNNLLQRSTQGPSESKEVARTDDVTQT